MRLTGHTRLSWGILGIAVLTAGVVWATRAAPTQSAPAGGPPAVAGASASGGNLDGAGAAIAGKSTALTPDPVWCCSAGSPLGLTVTGQATVRAAGSAARVSAIGKAIADAAGQAKAAASAAGISLGRIINMQVSAPYYPYPLAVGAAGGVAGNGTGPPGAPSVGSPAAAGASAVPCSGPSRDPGYRCVSTYASVTITWAIG
jgi:hypothetical protein